MLMKVVLFDLENDEEIEENTDEELEGSGTVSLNTTDESISERENIQELPIG